MRRAALLLVALLALGPRPAGAWFEETAVGARGVSLGFSALACVNDVTASYWNPAGLADLDRTQAIADYAKPYGVPDLNESALLVGTRAWNTGWAFGWHRVGISGAYAEDLFTLAAGRTLRYFPGGHVLSGGATFKFGRVGFQPFTDTETGEHADYGAQSKGSLDAALKWRTPWSVDFTWVGRDLLQPRYQFVAGSGGGVLPFRQELAMALRWNRESTLTGSWTQVDAHQSTFNIGLEIVFYDVFALRSGLSNIKTIIESNGDPAAFQYTGGFGIFHNGYQVDASAFTNHDLGASYRVSVLVPFGKAGSR